MKSKERYDRKVVAYKISKYNDNKLVIDTLNEAIQKRKDVKEWIEYYNIKRNKEKKEENNENELIYKMEAIIKYLKKQKGYKYKLYNRLCPGMGKPDSNIVEYSLDCLELINELIEKVNKKQRLSLFE